MKMGNFRNCLRSDWGKVVRTFINIYIIITFYFPIDLIKWQSITFLYFRIIYLHILFSHINHRLIELFQIFLGKLFPNFFYFISVNLKQFGANKIKKMCALEIEKMWHMLKVQHILGNSQIESLFLRALWHMVDTKYVAPSFVFFFWFLGANFKTTF